MPDFTALSAIGRQIWDARYRWRDGARVIDADPDASWLRVAAAIAEVEPAAQRDHWTRRYYRLIRSGRFLPGGRILAHAGTGRDATLCNCFVMGTVEDSMAGIFRALGESAQTLQRGGGIGCDFSTLRPAASPADHAGATASGPVAFMRLWDSACDTVLSTSTRRGAMMGTLRCDHPDVPAFIEAKREAGALTHFNLSVLVTDAFMHAVLADASWPLVFPAGADDQGPTVVRAWPGQAEAVRCRVHAELPARELWRRLVEASRAGGEPGVLFIDRINAANNLRYRECIACTNPCGEVPLPPYGACNLGSLNLARFVREPWTTRARVDFDALAAAVPVAVRLLDGVIDVSSYPLAAQRDELAATRRIGLGLTGLADALAMTGLHYGSEAARAAAARITAQVRDRAYRASVQLARERGAFPALSAAEHLQRPFVAALPADLRAEIAADGIRNSHLLSIAPAGSISLLGGNVAGGIEPVFARRQRRSLRQRDGSLQTLVLENYAYARWRRRGAPTQWRDALVTAAELSPEAHLLMQAAVQQHVDQAVSKTVNLPPDTSVEVQARLLEQAWRLGLKGCTTFRPNPVRRSVLTADDGPAPDVGMAQEACRTHCERA